MDLSDRGNPQFEHAMGLVRGAKLEYAERRTEAPAKETAHRRYLKERDRAQLAQAVYDGVMHGLSMNAIAEAYGTQDIRTVNKLFREAVQKMEADDEGRQFFKYTDRKSTRLNSSHKDTSRMPSSA